MQAEPRNGFKLFRGFLVLSVQQQCVSRLRRSAWRSASSALVGGSKALWTARQVAGSFTGARPPDVVPILESLATLGHLLEFPADDEPRWKAL